MQDIAMKFLAGQSCIQFHHYISLS